MYSSLCLMRDFLSACGKLEFFQYRHCIQFMIWSTPLFLPSCLIQVFTKVGDTLKWSTSRIFNTVKSKALKS